MSLPKTQKAVYIDGTSETWETIKYGDIETPQIGDSHDVIIKNEFSGINMIELYFRKGIYPASLPMVLGREASGTVVAVGDKVSKYTVGDKVAYIESKTFAQYTKISESKPQIVKLLPDVTEDQLHVYGGLLLQGLTALSLIDDAFKVEKDQYILVWAAAGGVGQLLTQIVANRGANVIAIASTDDKLEIAKSLGAKYTIKASSPDIVDQVLKITNGKGVEASFDSVGKDSFEISLAALARKGTLVSYGNASGPVPPFLITRLSTKNIKIVRPTLYNYITTDEEFQFYSQELIKQYESGKLKFNITKTYDLKDYATAAQDLEHRKTTGKLVLRIPN
jgi:NADPH2:quinone reductase